jgi:hypothetical protein
MRDFTGQAGWNSSAVRAEFRLKASSEGSTGSGRLLLSQLKARMTPFGTRLRAETIRYRPMSGVFLNEVCGAENCRASNRELERRISQLSWGVPGRLPNSGSRKSQRRTP